MMKGQLDEAIASCRKAVELAPKEARAHNNLGSALFHKGEFNEAVACYRKAIDLDPKDPEAHASLGYSLDKANKPGEAIDAWRRSVGLEPAQPNVWYFIARAEAQRDRFEEAAAAFQKVRELYPPGSPRVQQAQRFLLVAKRLPALLRGEVRPTDNAERMNFAWAAHDLHHFALAAQLWAEAIPSVPTLNHVSRYVPARSAALAAAGQGKADPPLDDAAKAKLRGLALGWLRADLAEWSKQLASATPQVRTEIVRILSSWQQDANLASLRDRETLAKLPADEQKAFTQFWADVAALLKKAEGKTK
jgi:Flp pilus assembly protein TadD